jgi:two-component system alkaline phosphatase synthesis response regulator PhoP
MNYLIYSVEDDKNIAHLLKVALTKQGYTVESFYDGESFIERFHQQKPNLILLDMMLPNIQGDEILKMIRDDDENDDIQIIIVSANRMVMDKVDGLDLGADDYIEKPFDILELMSRVNSKARRFYKKQRLVKGNFILDAKKHEFYKDNELVELTNKEFQIIELLMKKNGEVVSRDELFNKIWGNGILESRTIDMHVKSLRSKINDEDGTIIKSVYGIGYKIEL